MRARNAFDSLARRSRAGRKKNFSRHAGWARENSLAVFSPCLRQGTEDCHAAVAQGQSTSLVKLGSASGSGEISKILQCVGTAGVCRLTLLQTRYKRTGRETSRYAAVAQGQSTSLVRTGPEVRFLSAAPFSFKISALRLIFALQAVQQIAAAATFPQHPLLQRSQALPFPA